MGVAFLLLAMAAIVQFVSVFWGLGIPQGAIWLISIACLACMLVSIGISAHKRWDGVLIDRDNRISLSRFQLVVWTLVVLGSLQAAGIVNIATSMAFPGDVKFPFKIDGKVVLRGPLDIAIPPEIWILLGLGSFTAVAAPVIKTAQRLRALRPPSDADAILRGVKANNNLSKDGHFIGRVYANASAKDAKWINLVMGDYEGAEHIDVSKVQHLALTVLLVLTYSLALFELFNGREQKDLILAFPLVSPGFLSLLGISHAAYLADKAGGDT